MINSDFDFLVIIKQDFNLHFNVDSNLWIDSIYFIDFIILIIIVIVVDDFIVIVIKKYLIFNFSKK